VPLDVFELRDRVVGEYRDYFESFVNILDQRVEDRVRTELPPAGRGPTLCSS
jgi:hypothetical protein